jgi:hypothetical protein
VAEVVWRVNQVQQYIREHPGCSSKEIAAALNTSVQVVNYAIRHLDGRIEGHPDAGDGRVIRYSVRANLPTMSIADIPRAPKQLPPPREARPLPKALPGPQPASNEERVLTLLERIDQHLVRLLRHLTWLESKKRG